MQTKKASWPDITQSYASMIDEEIDCNKAIYILRILYVCK